ncbi:hypothetical protein KZO83_04480 [Chromohalobacter sp. TMW 2.2308]|uniref:hypothetical protein n=1 Tax=Chromohalobacter TaxID=42054 RepID=UPI001FFD23F9|nr:MULTISPECIES: hypothetical protein [Chromohalobacter]MCK2041943.1 hypothetical protein [Chromohalobacter moromii]MCT8514091.1 hypothetical protein [Chromohalobacter sp. TMW 2.2271]
MAKIETNVTQNEGWLAQLNGDYEVPFDEVEITASGALESGTVMATAGSAVNGSTTNVLGILAEDKPAGTKHCRVMTRGNPSTVNGKALIYGNATVADVNSKLEAKGIVVINK